MIQIVFASTLLFVVLAFAVIYFIVRYKNRERQFSLETQRLQFELEKKELRRSFGERELVLEEISQEIHDNIGQVMHMIAMNLHTIRDYSTNVEQVKVINKVAELAQYIIRDTRHIGYSLSTDFIKDRGLYMMLEYDMEQINHRKETYCTLQANGKEEYLSAESQLLIYRIAQEAIHNVLKHAHATLLEIELIFDPKLFVLKINDNGVGFDEPVEQGKGRTGLNNMRKRAMMLNGNIVIDSQPGQGCTIILTVPPDSDFQSPQ